MSGKRISLLFALLLALPVSASEAPPAGAAAGGAEKKEDVAKERPWVEVENKLGVLRSKRDAHTLAMKKLREERDQLPEGSAQFQEKHKEYLGVYKQWVTTGEDYNKLLGVLKYRYPERVVKSGSGRREKMEHKTAEQLDAELGIDGKLNKSLRNVRDQYGSQEGIKPEESKAAVDPFGKKKDDVGVEDSLSREPQIIIRK